MMKFHLKGNNKSENIPFAFEKDFKIDISYVNGNIEINLPEGTNDATLIED